MKKIGYIIITLLIKTHLAFGFQSPTEGVDLSPLNQLAAKLIENNQLTEAENAATNALALSKSENSTDGKAAALDNLGLIARERFDYTNAMNYFVEALKLKESVNNTRGVAMSKNNIGKVFYLQSNDSQALTNYQAGLNLLTNNVADLPILAETHRNIGDVYLNQKVYGKANQAFDMALKIWSENLHDFQKAATLASFLGKVNVDLKDYDGALNNFNASLNFHRMLNDEANMASDFVNLSKIYNELNDSDLAVQNANNALALFAHTNNSIGSAEASCQLAKIYLKSNDAASAAAFLDKSGAILRGAKFQPAMPELFKCVAEGYKQLGDLDKSYAYLSDYAVSKDSLFNVEKNRTLVEMTTKYESELSVKDKNRQLAALAKEKSVETKLRWLLIGLVLLSLIALWLVYQNYRRKKVDNQKLSSLNMQIQIQNEAISRQNDELEIKNVELWEKNASLDVVNSRLVEEVSERENAQNAHFSKDHYLADVSASMRDPLTIMVSEARELMLAQPRKDQEEHIKHLQFATNSLLVLINDVLSFSHIEAGKLTLAHQDFETAKVFQNIKTDLLPKINVSFETHLEKTLPKELRGDVVRLTQIMSYLTMGFQRLISDGLLCLSVNHKNLNDNELILNLNFLATGSLVKDDLIKNILTCEDCRDLFKTLSLEDMKWLTARRLIELQNGTVKFDEQENHTKLTVCLPFKKAVPITSLEDTEGTSIWANNNFLEGKRILIVEDNKINQMLVANMLKKRDVLVTTANDGLEALDALALSDFDLILMDIQMPRMDGYRAVAEIRRMKDQSKMTVPIIALTASAYINEKEKAQLFGMTDYIGKPFSPDELLDKIIRVLMSGNTIAHKQVMKVAA